jgi:hypothetical protein
MQPSFNTVVSRNEIDTNLISKLAAKTKQETETKKLFCGIQKKQQHFWSKKKSNTGQDLKQNGKFRHTYKLRPKCASKSALMMSLHRTTNGSFSNFLKLSCAKVQRTSYNTDSLYSSGRLSTLLVSERLLLLLLLLRWNKQKCGFNNRDHQTTQSKAKGGKTRKDRKRRRCRRDQIKRRKSTHKKLKENAQNTRNSENKAQEHEEEEEETGQDQQQQSSPRKEKEGKEKKEREKGQITKKKIQNRIRNMRLTYMGGKL